MVIISLIHGHVPDLMESSAFSSHRPFKASKSEVCVMDLRHLDYIVAIAEQGSISRAAEQVFSSQSALSHYLQKTEEQLGTLMFAREWQYMRLTEAGKTYVQSAKRILDIGRRTDEILEEIRNLRKGRITLGISQERGSIVLPCVVPAFQKAYAGISIEVQHNRTADLELAALQGNIDLAVFPIVKPMKRYAELEYEELCLDEMLLAVPNTHPLAFQDNSASDQRSVIDLRQLKDDPFVLKIKGSQIRDAADAIFKDYQITPYVQAEASNIYAVHNMAINLGALTFIPETLSHFPDLRQDCVYFSINSEKYYTKIMAAYRKGTFMNQAKRELIYLIRHCLNSHIQHRGQIDE